MAHPQIATFARVADGNTPAIRKLEGQRTKLGRTMHGIAYDPVHDEFLVAQPFAQAILVFRGGATGDAQPIRVIQGPLTQLEDPDKVEVDVVHNEIFVPEDHKVLVFPRDANGSVAPLRVLESTGKTRWYGIGVDAVNNALVLAGWDGPRETNSFLHIFNRTDTGKVAPKAVIRGPKTGLKGTFGLRAYGPRGWILVTMNGPEMSFPYDGAFVGIWSVKDNGDVPPRWTIGGPNGMLKQPRGIDIDPKNKTVIISDKALNAVLTYHLPEMF